MLIQHTRALPATQWIERTSRTLRTAPERHRLMLGLPEVKELPWLRPTAASPGAETVTDLDRDFIPPGEEVVSDTGQLRRQWAKGIFVVDTPKTQLVMGWIKGEPLHTADAGFAIDVPKAAVALSSLDGKSLTQSMKVLISTIARMAVGAGNQARTEPVAGTVTLLSAIAGLHLAPLAGDGRRLGTVPLASHDSRYTIVLPTDQRQDPPRAEPSGQSEAQAATEPASGDAGIAGIPSAWTLGAANPAGFRRGDDRDRVPDGHLLDRHTRPERVQPGCEFDPRLSLVGTAAWPSP
jgi:hypothetical protein